jgi:hypothetical protein
VLLALTCVPALPQIGAGDGTAIVRATLGAPVADETAPASAGPCCVFDWARSKYRFQNNFWVTGYTGNPHTGPGYYSLLDRLRGESAPTTPKYGYPRTVAIPLGFMEANFAYVDNPDRPLLLTERLHGVHLGDNWMFGTGGEYRNRFNYEGNARLTGATNSFDLNRVRLFGELWYQDRLRVFAEFLDARTTDQNLTPLQSDRNYADILNLFIDVKTLPIGDDAVYARLGRQQLLLGSQRIISTSDWGFTGRTFEGVRVFYRSEVFDANLFWLQPVIPKFDQPDRIDTHQHFAGLYTTYRPAKDRFLDTYWLYFNNQNSPAQARQSTVGALATIAPYDVHTLGFRYAGKGQTGWLWDSENMLQLGRAERGRIVAGNLSNGIGYYLRDLPLTPTIWTYFDYASGSANPGGTNTFNQLFPLAHYYLGQADYVGRANIQDLNFHLYLYPSNWTTLNVQYHIFQLAQAKDALYNTSSAVSRADPTGKAGRDVGSELDVSAAFHLGPRTDVLAVYSYFFPGRFLNSTGPSSNANTVYLLFNYRW